VPRKFILILLLAGASLHARAADELRLWHAVGGWPGVELESLLARFNASQREVRVVAGYSGEAQAAARDARRRGAALLVLPYNASLVLYYNRDALRRAGLEPEAPKTWYEMAPAIGALVEAGQACGYVTASPARILLENAGAWPEDSRVAFDNVMVRWVAMLASWQRSGYFSYASQAEDAEGRFVAGQCAYLTASPSRQVELRSRAAFDLGVAPLPHYEDFAGARQGGAGVWLLPERSKREYRVAARLLAWLARPEVQAEWREKTGGAQLAPAGYDLPALRRIVDEELESVWVGRKSALDALNMAVLRGNELIGK
jgi:sn-glycerol 3-phosphate transport system substrate-binding protein